MRKKDHLPSSSFLEDWLPEGHLARLVVEIVEKLDLRSLKDSYSGRGSYPYNPVMLIAPLFYGYATGVESNGMMVKESAIVDATIIESSRRPIKVTEVMPEDRREEKSEMPASVSNLFRRPRYKLDQKRQEGLLRI